MDTKIDINLVYVLSEDVVMREIDKESIIVPIAAGIGDMEDELYTVNETGKAILSMLDGKKNLKEVIKALSSGFETKDEDIAPDVTGFINELYRRKIIIEAA